MQKFSKEFHLTGRESEILEKLITTEDGVQEMPFAIIEEPQKEYKKERG